MAATSSSDWYALSPGSKKLGRNVLHAQRSGLGNAAASPEMRAPLIGGDRVSHSSGKSACSQAAQGQSNFEKFLRQTHDDLEKGSAYTLPMQGLFDTAERRIDFLGPSCQKTSPIDSRIDASAVEASLYCHPNHAKINELQPNGAKFQMANKTLGPILQKAGNLESCATELRQQSPSNKSRLLPQQVQFVNPARIIHTDAKHKSAKQQSLIQSE